MADGKIEHSELLKAQAHIWNHIFNFINSMSLKCAVELGIPDIINSHGKPITISELSSALSIHPNKAHCVPRLMRVLVHSGFFAVVKTNQIDNEKHHDKEGYAYALTNSSKLLLKDSPFSLTTLLTLNLDPALSKPWQFVSSWFVNDDPTPFSTTHGMTLWDYAVHDPKINTVFNKAMSNDSRLVSSVLVNEGKEVFDGLNSVADVGGGNGIVAKAIAEAFPSIECTVLDLPHVVAGLNDTPNLKYIAGDMFDSIPPADAVILKILKNCKKAVKGKLIIIDIVKEIQEKDNEAIETQLFFDMLMMVFFAGKERDEKEWAKLASDAGFSGYKITPILGLRSIIEVYP